MATTTSVHSHGVMEGNGAYNRHARIPAGGAALALPLLEEAVRSLDLRGRDEPVVVADYGSSQGKNSLTPMRAAIRGLRTRIGPDRPIFVTHVDQPANDFNTLFDVLHNDPECYSADDPNVFPSAIGRSFYESVFPKEHVHLGWSSYAAVWLSRIPMPIAGHFVSVGSKGAVRTAFERQGADDWKLFLSLRATELRPGGRLVVVLPALNDEGTAGLEPLFERANESLAALVAEGAISNEDRMRMVLGAHPRRRSELLAPFRADGRFCGLTVECCELSTVPDAAWADYQRKGDEDALSTRRAQFFRSVFVPSLASAICDEAKRTAFPDRLEEKLKRRLAERPVPLDSFVQTIVLARESSNSIHRT